MSTRRPLPLRCRRSLPWLRHFMRRHLHLPRYVLWSLRLAQANPARREAKPVPLLPPWMGCHYRCCLGGYPIDTVRRRMMMTSGGGVKYNGSMDCFSQVVKNEGVGSLFKGAGANVMRGMGGAAVLAFCDVFKDAYVSR